VALEWAWAWPANRRILYNRASADPQGRPWSERKRYVWWDAETRRWTGEDVPDFIADRPPSYCPPEGATGLATIAGDAPFMLQADGRGWLFAPNGLVDGPLPTHYEPEEAPFKNPFYAQQCNPTRLEWRRRDNPYHRAWDDPRYPHVMTTYRLTEHHTAGAMSRWLSWLSELQPEMFCEVSPELARACGLVNGGWATLSTARAEIEARVLVTQRMPPLRLKTRVVHQIGVPYHWGSTGRAVGDAANELIGFVGDPNVTIQESKALTCAIRPGRRSRGRRVVTSGPLAAALPAPLEPLGDERAGAYSRDQPPVSARQPGPHGMVAAEAQRNEES
jgi:formate dehydrogenase major subunit